MIAGTHIAFSTTLYLAGAGLLEYQPSLTGWAIAAAASLLPDIDLPTSRLGRVLFPISTRLERHFGHRTITHSLLALAVLGVLASPLYSLGKPLYWWALIGGYWSHLFIDMLNLRGADLLWPLKVRMVMPGNKNYRMETGGKAEMVLLIALVGFSALFYPVSGIGFRHGLANLLGNFDMAKDNYLRNAGQHWYTLRMEAIDNLTLERVKCECPIVGTWTNSLIVLQGGELRAVGESQQAANLFPVNVALVEGEPLRVVAHRVDMRGRSVRWLLDQLGTGRTVYLSGELRMGSRLDTPVQDLDQYRPARFSGQVLKLHYARPQDLTRYLGMVPAEGELFVQVWLRPGDPAVELAVGAHDQADPIPEALKGYL